MRLELCIFFIDEGRRCSQKFISNILKRAVNLEKIHLEFSKGIKDPCLLHITDKCTELSLPECKLDSGNLSQVRLFTRLLFKKMFLDFKTCSTFLCLGAKNSSKAKKIKY